MNFKELIPTYNSQSSPAFKYKFTVFTPVFNCENSIVRVHDSLLNQTFKDFEWLVINDASTDSSHEVITKIIETSPLNINYINNKENKHKMSCFIQSIKLAQGEFLLTFDGDDECYPEALQFFNDEYEDISDELKPKVAAVTVLCNDQHGNLVGNPFPEDLFYCNTFEARITKKIIGEKWGFTKTEVLRNIIIHPEMLNYGFVPESMIWDPVAGNGFLTKCVNKVLRIYHVGVEGSIMNTPMTARSAFGTVLKGLAVFDWFYKRYFFKSPVFFLKTLYITVRSTRYLDYPLKDYLSAIDSYIIKTIVILIWPFRRFMV
jgi:glycosyltransferase involved in cell wall biosynthesis